MSSKLDLLVTEAIDRLKAVVIPGTSNTMAGRVVEADDADDLLDKLKGLKAYPGIGVVYEGMRSMPEGGDTGKMGLSSEVAMAFVLVEYGGAILNSPQKASRPRDWLHAMREQVMGQRSTATGHFWKFQVEAKAEIKGGMVCWIQRWSVPIQLRPAKP